MGVQNLDFMWFQNHHKSLQTILILCFREFWDFQVPCPNLDLPSAYLVLVLVADPADPMFCPNKKTYRLGARFSDPSTFFASGLYLGRSVTDDYYSVYGDKGTPIIRNMSIPI